MVSAYDQERKGFWREPEGTSTSEVIALEEWAISAHELMVETAMDYHAVLRESEFAERVQDRSGVHTTRETDRWLRKLLGPMAVVHRRAGDPPLTSLVVGDDGRVGERHADLLLALEELPITEAGRRERHAAEMRLLCYQWAGSAPADGGVPAALPSNRAPRAPRAAAAPRAAREPAAPRTPRAPREPKPMVAKRLAVTDRPVTVCPTCFMAVPATGICDNCG